MTEEVFVYDGLSMQIVEIHDHPLQVADSFLVSDGRVRSIDKHRSRFNTSAEKLTNLNLDDFWQQAISLIPRQGQVFPRIELSGDKLVLRLREPIDFKPEVILWTADEPDVRIDSTTKGPDLDYGSALRRKSNLYGADEAVFLDENGFVVEGALSSLLWWRDDILFAPDNQTRWLPSVTRAELFEIAAQAGYQTGTEHVGPGELIGLELWVASALTGIRPVVGWVNLNGEVGAQKHLESFQRRLKLMASEL